MNQWALVMVSMAVVFAIAFPAVGLYLFSTPRARAVKHAELRDGQVITHVAQLRLAHPEIVKVDRLDHHPAYICVNLSLLAFGSIVMFDTAPYSNLGSAALGTQHTLGISLLLGAGMTLIGAALGAGIGNRRVSRRICDNVVSAQLGDDVRIPYVLAWWGLLSTLVSMGFYAYAVIASSGLTRYLTTAGGILSIGVAVMSSWLIPVFIARIRRYIDERIILIDEAARIIATEDRP